MIKVTGLEDGNIVFVDLARVEGEEVGSRNVKCRFVNGLFQDVDNNSVYGSSVVRYR